MFGIDTDKEIVYIHGSLREFLPGEHHVERVCDSEVLLMGLSGVLRFSEDGEERELRAGEYYIQRNGGYHRGDMASDCPKYLYVHFRGEWADNRNCLPRSGTFALEDAVEDIYRLHGLAYGNGSRTELLAVFYGLLAFLVNGKNHTESMAEGIVGHLTEDLKRPPSLSELAETFHFSKNHIISIVKREFAMTPYEYLKRERLRRAVTLMGSTSLPFEEIAEQSGFSDYTVFFKAFKSVYGESPSEWRAKNRKYTGSSL